MACAGGMPSAARAIAHSADPTYRFPFGWHERLVSDATVYGTVQRPWAPDERPADCLDRTALERRIHDARRRGATT